MVSAAILAHVVATQDFHAAGAALAGASHGAYLALLAIFLVAVLLLDAAYVYAAARWLAGVGSFGDLLRARAATYLLVVVNFLVGLGGLAFYLRRRYGVPAVRGASIAATELVQDLGAMGALTVVAVALAPRAQGGSAAPLRAAALVGAACAGAWGLAFLLSRLGGLLAPRARPPALLAPLCEASAARWLGLFALKLAKCALFAAFVVAALRCFGLRPPIATAVALGQLALLAHGLPVSAFGLGVDQVTFPALFGAFEAGHPGRALAFSLVYTASLLCGRIALALPFVRGVARDMRA